MEHRAWRELQVTKLILHAVHLALECLELPHQLPRVARRPPHVTQYLHVDVVRTLQVKLLSETDGHL